MQASLLSTAALTAEVGVLKQDLERTEQELGLAKRRLEEEEGKKYLTEKVPIKRLDCKKSNRIVLLIVGATTEVATLKQALSEAEKKTAAERTERDRLGAQVGEVQQELQALSYAEQFRAADELPDDSASPAANSEATITAPARSATPAELLGCFRK